MIILDKFPAAEEFYKTYWGRKPFLVRGGVDVDAFDGFIDADMLAGLSMEDELKSRIVLTAPEGGKWTCEHGPFEEDRYDTIGDKNWSLLVQNVEQYHTDTANLLRNFNFSPRWLLDDIMVSYSATGGSVGPHTDSYHVFLVQGMGKRIWTVGDAPIQNEQLIEGLDLKVLKDGVAGEGVEVNIGDILYIPPHFAHEGVTLDHAMTFSVGFLGPKLSELFIEYGQYLEHHAEALDTRYSGQGLNADSSCFTIAPNAQKSVQGALTDALQGQSFSAWLAAYFSTPTDSEDEQQREEPLTDDQVKARLKAGEGLYRPEHIKLSITASQNGMLNLSVFGAVITMEAARHGFVHWLNNNATVSFENVSALGGEDELLPLITQLYNQGVLYFEGDEMV